MHKVFSDPLLFPFVRHIYHVCNSSKVFSTIVFLFWMVHNTTDTIHLLHISSDGIEYNECVWIHYLPFFSLSLSVLVVIINTTNWILSFFSNWFFLFLAITVNLWSSTTTTTKKQFSNTRVNNNWLKLI